MLGRYLPGGKVPCEWSARLWLPRVFVLVRGEEPVPIIPLLQGRAFGPEEIEVMSSSPLKNLAMAMAS